MLVKAVREHSNVYGVANGAKRKKSVGTEYDLPDNMAKTLIDAGLVAKVEEKKAK